MNEDDPISSKIESAEIARVEKQIANELEARLPAEPVERQELANTIAEIVSVEVSRLVHFQGPLPPPDWLKEYDAITPGLATRIVDRADKEQDFRHEMQKESARLGHRILTHKIVQSHIGQGLGFVIGMTVIVGGIYLISIDKGAAGLASIVAALVALVGVFVSGKYLRNRSAGDKEDVVNHEGSAID